ncbi:thermostable hemolysin [Paenirhodobacter enshiensis]|uniref:thermostable hemolysin n=1 Tax=Paenirhodobacter enshiensis TaxID=1105367 RepID=UPI003FA3039B
MKIECYPVFDPRRTEIETYIRDEFRRVFGADIQPAQVPMIAARNGDGAPIAAAGLRIREDGFFSEIYLDQPIETALSDAFGAPVERNDIVEVVSLASSAPLAVLPLIEAITEAGRRMGKRCAVFTATTPLFRLLTRTGVPLQRLTPARSDRIDRPDRWGTYYETDPWVCALPDFRRPLAFLPPRALHRFTEICPCR